LCRVKIESPVDLPSHSMISSKSSWEISRLRDRSQMAGGTPAHDELIREIQDEQYAKGFARTDLRFTAVGSDKSSR
jgi:hypothetical protein